MKIDSAFWTASTVAVLCGVLTAQSSEGTQPPEDSAEPAIATSSSPCSQVESTIDVLNDSEGLNLRPYVRRMNMAVRQNWYRRIPESERDKTVCLAITFVLRKDGQVTDMKIERSSGDESSDRAAWSALERTEFFPAFPGPFQGDHLAFRFNFVYNPARHLHALQEANEPPTIVSTSADGPVYSVGHGITPPRGTYMPSPEYSDKARKKKLQGTVILQIVVSVEGQVRDAKVTKSLEPSLDEQAIRAVNNWKFQPGKKDGVPVAVQLMTEVSFHLY